MLLFGDWVNWNSPGCQYQSLAANWGAKTYGKLKFRDKLRLTFATLRVNWNYWVNWKSDLAEVNRSTLYYRKWVALKNWDSTIQNALKHIYHRAARGKSKKKSRLRRDIPPAPLPPAKVTPEISIYLGRLRRPSPPRMPLSIYHALSTVRTSISRL